MENETIFIIGDIHDQDLQLLKAWLQGFGVLSRHIKTPENVPKTKNGWLGSVRGVIALKGVVIEDDIKQRLSKINIPIGTEVKIIAVPHADLTSKDLKNIYAFLREIQ